MDWCDEALSRFCQLLGVAVPSPQGALIHLEFGDIGTLQLERHEQNLTVWLEVQVPVHRASEAMHRALTLTSSHNAPELPLRCGWVGEASLLLFITLADSRVTLSILQQAFGTLKAARTEVLSA